MADCPTNVKTPCSRSYTTPATELCTALFFKPLAHQQTIPWVGGCLLLPYLANPKWWERRYWVARPVIETAQVLHTVFGGVLLAR